MSSRRALVAEAVTLAVLLTVFLGGWAIGGTIAIITAVFANMAALVWLGWDARGWWDRRQLRRSRR